MLWMSNQSSSASHCPAWPKLSSWKSISRDNLQHIIIHVTMVSIWLCRKLYLQIFTLAASHNQYTIMEQDRWMDVLVLWVYWRWNAANKFYMVNFKTILQIIVNNHSHFINFRGGRNNINCTLLSYQGPSSWFYDSVHPPCLFFCPPTTLSPLD